MLEFKSNKKPYISNVKKKKKNKSSVLRMHYPEKSEVIQVEVKLL